MDIECLAGRASRDFTDTCLHCRCARVPCELVGTVCEPRLVDIGDADPHRGEIDATYAVESGNKRNEQLFEYRGLRRAGLLSYLQN